MKQPFNLGWYIESQSLNKVQAGAKATVYQQVWNEVGEINNLFHFSIILIWQEIKDDR
jgi:hypothetical protein